MKIIWITAECPFPANTGGRAGVWNRIRYLSKNNSIILYMIADEKIEKNNMKEILKYCQEAYAYVRANKFFSVLKSIYLPYSAVSRWNTHMKIEIENKCKEISPDIIMVDFPQMMGVLNADICKCYRVVLNEHNNEYETLFNIAESCNNILKKFLYSFTAYRMKKYEETLYESDVCAMYTFVSVEDKKSFETKYPDKITFLVPVGAEIKDTNSVINLNKHNAAFISKLSYPPNHEGATWLMDKVWPLVCEKISDARLYIVGKEPRSILLDKTNENMIVTGLVDSVESYYECSSIILVPIFCGGGVKVKLLEALGHHKLVITTTKGIEGTKFIPNVDLLVADNHNDFANLCILAFENIEKFNAIADSGFEKTCTLYSWEKIIEEFENRLEELL